MTFTTNSEAMSPSWTPPTDHLVKRGIGPGGGARAPGRANGAGNRSLPARLTILVLVIGAIVTTELTITSRVGYTNDEQRLTNLETQLTGSALGVAQVDIQRRVGQAMAVASAASNPGAKFASVIGPSMVPKGPFTTAGLRLVKGSSVVTLVHVGTKSIVNPAGKAATALYLRAAKSSSLVTQRIVGQGQQRLSYLLSLKTPQGTFVAAATEELPANRRVVVPAGSPNYGLNYAIYFGTKINQQSLIESTSDKVPFTGITSSVRVPLGSSIITVVTQPRGSLAGAWAEFIPWGILIVGTVFTIAIAAMTQRLDRRNRRAEGLTRVVTDLYREQRTNSETLQRGLLPKVLPSIAGVEISGLYLPGSVGLEVGGDWYSAIAVDDHRFTFVVGDVSGHGVSAATVMASLRYTARAFASIGYQPAEILNRAGMEIDVTADQHFATVLVGMVDNARHEITLASAGHLRPVMVADRTATFLDVPVGRPLGIRATPYEQVTFPIPAGATLVAFTDGLIERRGESIDVGMDLLLQTCRVDVESIAVADLLAHVVSELEYDASDDDVALLGIRWLR